MKRASYRHGVYWIAENDEPEETSPDEMARLLSTLLLADLFGKDPKDVAADILKHRRRPGSDLDDRLYAATAGARVRHIMRDDDSGYFDAGTLCGVTRGLGEPRDATSPMLADYRVCPKCLKAEGAD